MNNDTAFCQQRSEAFDQVIVLIDGHIRAATPVILSSFDEMSADALRQSAEKEVWSLFQQGVQHLKNGAPGQQPGSVTGALSRMSLRSSAFAAALGVKPPQFEQKYFSIDFTNGHEAALFFCTRLTEAAAGDLSKSRQIIQQKMLLEKPDTFGVDAAALKRQMVFSFNILAETYARTCQDFKSALSDIPPGAPPPARPKSGGKGFNL